MLEKIDTITLEIVDDPSWLRALAPLACPLHEYRARRPNALIDEHHEYRVLVAKGILPNRG